MSEAIKPNPIVIDALRGVVSEPIQTVSYKPGTEGQIVTVRLALEGPALFGLTDCQDNQDWSGLMNHFLLSARYSTFFASKMAQTGYEVNPQRVLNGMIVSHAGRRQWDEAGWYPEAVSDAPRKRNMSNETLGLHLIHNRVPSDVFELVASLAHNLQDFSVDSSIYDHMDFRLAIYVDHRTSHQYEPLHRRMGDFVVGNFFRGGEVTPDLRERIYAEVEGLIRKQRDYRLGKTGGEGVSLDEADQIIESLGAQSDSPRLARKELMRFILRDADTESALIQSGIDPHNINDQTVPMPEWEGILRYRYVVSARSSLIEAISNIPDRQFTQNTWWEQYARRVISDWYSEGDS